MSNKSESGTSYSSPESAARAVGGRVKKIIAQAGHENLGKIVPFNRDLTNPIMYLVKKVGDVWKFMGGPREDKSQRGGAAMRKRGTREEVWNRVAEMTTGGLTRKDLVKRGEKIMSKKMIARGKLAYKKYLKGRRMRGGSIEAYCKKTEYSVNQECIDEILKANWVHIPKHEFEKNAEITNNGGEIKYNGKDFFLMSSLAPRQAYKEQKEYLTTMSNYLEHLNKEYVYVTEKGAHAIARLSKDNVDHGYLYYNPDNTGGE